VLVATFCGLAAGLATAATAPLVNAYELVPPITTSDITLTSSLDCGAVRCDIAYRIASRPVDRFVTVSWNDAAGNVLVSASSVNLGFFYGGEIFGPGVIEATQFKKNQNIGGRSVTAKVGTADFTGTGSGSDPCGIGYVCHDADYYEFLPSPFGSAPGGGGSSGAPETGRASVKAVASGALGSIGGTLSGVAVDPADFGLVEPGVEVPFITFTSAVYDDGGAFRYRYEVANHTDLAIPFEWSEAGLNGTLAAFGLAEREIVAPAAPSIGQSLPSWILRTEGAFPLTMEFAATLELLTPVPEPSAAALFAAGLGCLLGLRSARRIGAGCPPPRPPRLA
jgi:hypothetical protein